MDRAMSKMMTVGLIATLATATAVEAQGRGPQRVPPGHLPPAGMCRVWYDGVPPGRQPAATSCRDAERRAGRNARVIYGDARNDRNDRYDRYDRYDRDDDRYDRYDRDDDRYDGSRYERRDDRGDDRRGRARGEPGRTRLGGPAGSRGSGTPCVDRDRDGYCDRVNSRALPAMSRTSTLGSIQRTAAERVWVGEERTTARYTDRDRNGVPEEILWYDYRGKLVQRWQDHDLDGRADEVVFYRDGKVLETVRAGY